MAHIPTSMGEEVLSSVSKLFASGEYSDLEVICDGETFKVHKNIVCSQSEFFAGAIRFGGKVDLCRLCLKERRLKYIKEAQSNTIPLPEDEPEFVRLMFQYMYEGDYAPKLMAVTRARGNEYQRFLTGHATFPYCECYGSIKLSGADCSRHLSAIGCASASTVDPRLSLSGSSGADLLTHSKVYKLADKYGLNKLKSIAALKFALDCEVYWYDSMFSVAATHIFTSLPEDDGGLRNMVIDTIVYNMELTRKADVETFLNSVDGLAVKVLKRVAEHKCLTW